MLSSGTGRHRAECCRVLPHGSASLRRCWQREVGTAILARCPPGHACPGTNCTEPAEQGRAVARQPGQFPNTPLPLSPKPTPSDPEHRQTPLFTQTLNISQREYSGKGMLHTCGRQALGAVQKMALSPPGLVTLPEGWWSW